MTCRVEPTVQLKTLPLARFSVQASNLPVETRTRAEMNLSETFGHRLMKAFRSLPMTMPMPKQLHHRVPVSGNFHWLLLKQPRKCSCSGIVFVSPVVLQTFTHSVHSSGNNVSSTIKVKNCQFIKSCLFPLSVVFFSVFF